MLKYFWWLWYKRVKKDTRCLGCIASHTYGLCSALPYCYKKQIGMKPKIYIFIHRWKKNS